MKKVKAVPCLGFCLLVLTGTGVTGERVTSESLPLAHHRVVLTIDDGYKCVYENVYPLLKRYRMTATIGLIVNYLRNASVNYGQPNSFLSYKEVKEMIDSCGVEVASHTLSHPWLTQLDSARAWEEIYRSRVVLESIFEIPVITFIYPYGDMDRRIKRLVRRAGYRLARAVRGGEVNLWVEPFCLPEFELRRETSLEAVKEHILKNPVSILLIHRIVPKPSVFTEWSIMDFGKLLSWLYENGARTVTLAELYDDWRQEVAGLRIKERAIGSPEAEILLKEIDIDNTRTRHPARSK